MSFPLDFFPKNTPNGSAYVRRCIYYDYLLLEGHSRLVNVQLRQLVLEVVMQIRILLAS